jgi:hypothetical protein
MSHRDVATGSLTGIGEIGGRRDNRVLPGGHRSYRSVFPGGVGDNPSPKANR